MLTVNKDSTSYFEHFVKAINDNWIAMHVGFGHGWSKNHLKLNCCYIYIYRHADKLEACFVISSICLCHIFDSDLDTVILFGPKSGGNV